MQTDDDTTRNKTSSSSKINNDSAESSEGRAQPQLITPPPTLLPPFTRPSTSACHLLGHGTTCSNDTLLELFQTLPLTQHVDLNFLPHLNSPLLSLFMIEPLFSFLLGFTHRGPKTQRKTCRAMKWHIGMPLRVLIYTFAHHSLQPTCPAKLGRTHLGDVWSSRGGVSNRGWKVSLRLCQCSLSHHTMHITNTVPDAPDQMLLQSKNRSVAKYNLCITLEKKC